MSISSHLGREEKGALDQTPALEDWEPCQVV